MRNETLLSIINILVKYVASLEKNVAHLEATVRAQRGKIICK